MPVWLDGVPHRPAGFPSGVWFAPSGECWHRTIGFYPGDYSVLTRGLVPSVHFLVGHNDGEWCQMYPADLVQYGAAGANSRKVHVEVSGQQGEEFTAWQQYACRHIHNGLVAAFGWSRDWTSEAAARTWIDMADKPGAVNHRNVDYPPNRAYNHYDAWADAYAVTLDIAPAPTPTFALSGEDDDMGFATAVIPGKLWETFRVDDSGRVQHHYYPRTNPAEVEVVANNAKPGGTVRVARQVTADGGAGRADVWYEKPDGSLGHVFQAGGGDWAWHVDTLSW